MNNEFVWTLKVDGEDCIWKCVVTDTECITYEGDKECKHLKITNPQKKRGVLQIDTVTTVYGEMIPFQLENGVPYLKIGGKWKLSVTSFEERKRTQLKTFKLTSLVQLGIGAVACIACLIRWIAQGSMGNWFIVLIIGSIAVVAGAYQYYDINRSAKEM